MRGPLTAGNATADNAGHRYARIKKFGLLLWFDFDAGELAPSRAFYYEFAIIRDEKNTKSENFLSIPHMMWRRQWKLPSR